MYNSNKTIVFKKLNGSGKFINMLAANAAAISGGSVPISFTTKQSQALVHPDFVQNSGELLDIVFNKAFKSSFKLSSRLV